MSKLLVFFSISLSISIYSMCRVSELQKELESLQISNSVQREIRKARHQVQTSVRNFLNDLSTDDMLELLSLYKRSMSKTREIYRYIDEQIQLARSGTQIVNQHVVDELDRLEAFKDSNLLELIRIHKEAIHAEVRTVESLANKFPNEVLHFRKRVPVEGRTRVTEMTQETVPLEYEIDIELKCCIIEVTTRGRDIIGSKEKQLRRFTNNSLLNPEGKKKVIVFAPNLSKEELISESIGISSDLGENHQVELIRNMSFLENRLEEIIGEEKVNAILARKKLIKDEISHEEARLQKTQKSNETPQEIAAVKETEAERPLITRPKKPVKKQVRKAQKRPSSNKRVKKGSTSGPQGIARVEAYIHDITAVPRSEKFLKRLGGIKGFWESFRTTLKHPEFLEFKDLEHILIDDLFFKEIDGQKKLFSKVKEKRPGFLTQKNDEFDFVVLSRNDLYPDKWGPPEISLEDIDGAIFTRTNDIQLVRQLLSEKGLSDVKVYDRRPLLFFYVFAHFPSTKKRPPRIISKGRMQRAFEILKEYAEKFPEKLNQAD